LINDEDAALLAHPKVRTMFEDIVFAGNSGQDESFIKTWLRDPLRFSVQTLNYTPHAADKTDLPVANEFNLFRGFGDYTEVPPSAREVKRMVRIWREVGIQLCEGSKSKFEFLEQWLAHLIQFPAERTNISFAFLGSPQGAFKNAFFAPLRKILGRHNFLETSDIHHVVTSSKEQSEVACKLFVVLDEANKQSTRLFQGQLKVTVTGTTARVRRPYQAAYEVDAHHRFVVLSNYIDGLGVDFKSGNRRFVLLQPTGMLRRMPCYNDFQEAYVERFVNPGNPSYLNALYGHLSALSVPYKSSNGWEGKAQELNKYSAMEMKAKPAPLVAAWLHKTTEPSHGEFVGMVGGDRLFQVNATNGVYRCDPESLPEEGGSRGGRAGAWAGWFQREDLAKGVVRRVPW